MAQNRISTEQARRLDDVGMIWDQEKERWETGFKALEVSGLKMGCGVSVWGGECADNFDDFLARIQDFIVKFGYANVRQSMKGYTSYVWFVVCLSWLHALSRAIRPTTAHVLTFHLTLCAP